MIKNIINNNIIKQKLRIINLLLYNYYLIIKLIQKT